MCRAIAKREGEKRKSLEYKIVSETTETVRFVPKRFFRKMMMSFCFGAKESDLLSISVQSSPEHSRLNAFETPQLTLRAMFKWIQQFPMLRLFAWGRKFDWFQTLRDSSKQHATTCNRVTDTTCNFQQ